MCLWRGVEREGERDGGEIEKKKQWMNENGVFAPVSMKPKVPVLLSLEVHLPVYAANMAMCGPPAHAHSPVYLDGVLYVWYL